MSGFIKRLTDKNIDQVYRLAQLNRPLGRSTIQYLINEKEEHSSTEMYGWFLGESEEFLYACITVSYITVTPTNKNSNGKIAILSGLMLDVSKHRRESVDDLVKYIKKKVRRRYCTKLIYEDETKKIITRLTGKDNSPTIDSMSREQTKKKLTQATIIAELRNIMDRYEQLSDDLIGETDRQKIITVVDEQEKLKKEYNELLISLDTSKK